jgi:hypothetical protein
MSAEDNTDRLRVGGWISEEGPLEYSRPPGHTSENTLGRQFAWPVGADPAGGPGGPGRHGMPAGGDRDPADWDPADWDPADWDPADRDLEDWDPADRDPEEWDPADGDEPVADPVAARSGRPWLRSAPGGSAGYPPDPFEAGYATGDDRDLLDPDRRYRGLRRARGLVATLAGQRWPVVAGAVVAVTIALTVLVVVASTNGRHTTTTAPPGGAAGAGASAPGAGAPGPAVTGTPATAAPVPSARRASPRRVLPPPVRASPTVLRPVAYEAEAPGNLLTGSARVGAYPGASGGQVVHNIGAWNGGAGPGTLTFPKVLAPVDGVYTLTFFFVHLNNEPQRTVVITIGDIGSFSVPVTGSATCCAAKAVSVPLQQGANAITFGNPDGHAPSIDKIVISGI